MSAGESTAPRRLRVGDQPDFVIRGAFENVITGGGVALFPADTVYGLACDPLRAEAIARIHELKGRDVGKPSAVMYFSPLAMRELIGDFGPRTREAVAGLLPGPVTLVVANPAGRYPLACGPTPDKLGVRLIEGPLAGARVAVFQTSANRSGDQAVPRFAEVDPVVVDGVDLVIDAGDLGGAPSTVVDISSLDSTGEWSVLREGAADPGKVAQVLG